MMSGNSEKNVIDDRPDDLDFRYPRDRNCALKELDDLIRFVPGDALISAEFKNTEEVGEHLHITILIPIGPSFDRDDDEDEW
jgi:hypothetical protein